MCAISFLCSYIDKTYSYKIKSMFSKYGFGIKKVIVFFAHAYISLVLVIQNLNNQTIQIEIIYERVYMQT